MLIAVALAAFVVAGLVPAVPQDQAYHDFADRRPFLGVPHGLNVMSNVGFLVAGVWAFLRVARTGLPGWELAAVLLYGAGLVLTALGSAWYHQAPTSETLVWDRLPLSLLFPTVFAVAVGDRVSVAAGRALLAPLAVAAVGSVVYWNLTDDLRPYALAQFLPMLLIPLMLALLPGRRRAAYLVAGVGVYGVGKIAELADRAIFALGGVVSGHTLKHLLGAVAAGLILLWMVPACLAPPAPGSRRTSQRHPSQSRILGFSSRG